LKTIATFSKPEEAHLFRTRMEAAGIPAYVQDEHFIQMDWLVRSCLQTLQNHQHLTVRLTSRSLSIEYLP